MAIIDALLPEYDRETGLTRRLLERLPEGRLAWKPHPRSMSLGRLASHLGEVLVWLAAALREAEFELPGDRYSPTDLPSKADILDYFDRNTSASRALLAGVSDAQLMQPWSLKRHGHVLFTLPRIAVIRSLVMNHLIHHRGQFSIYLRENEVPLPPMYGPSADEGS
jgi:uncharacterized damage-inducible protein DinB